MQFQNDQDRAAYDLRESNKVNALRVGGDGTLGAAYDQNGMSTGGFNASAYAPGFASHVSMGGGQAPQQQPTASSNPYLQAQPSATVVGGGAQGGTPWGQAPWVQQSASALTRSSNQNLAQNVMPGIRSGAQAAGQYGGSRQGVAEGVAAGNAQTGLDSAIAGLYGSAYGMDQTAALQNKNLNNSYNLGMGNLGLQNQGQMQNFYGQQRGQDLQQTQIGAGLYGMGNQGNLGIGAGQYALGQQAQNAPLTAVQGYSNTISPYSGLGSSQTSSQTQGGGLQGALGGALGGAQLWNNMGNLGMGGGYNMYGGSTGAQNSALMSQFGNGV